MQVEEKFVCPFCGFESNGQGLCPTCDENLEKVCYCGSGKFSANCCGAASEEEKNKEKLMAAELSTEALAEMAKEQPAEEEEAEAVEEAEED
jgi:hypothetical protein